MLLGFSPASTMLLSLSAAFGTATMLLSLSRASRNRDDAAQLVAGLDDAPQLVGGLRKRDDAAQLVAGLDDELDNGGSTGGLSRYLLDGYLEPDLATFLSKKRGEARFRGASQPAVSARLLTRRAPRRAPGAHHQHRAR